MKDNGIEDDGTALDLLLAHSGEHQTLLNLCNWTIKRFQTAAAGEALYLTKADILEDVLSMSGDLLKELRACLRT